MAQENSFWKELQETIMRKRTRLASALLAAIFVFAALKPSYALFDKTRFVAHLGVAFFAFHHFVSQPYKAGAFEANAPHRTKAIVKGGAALLFALHEVKVANRIAHKSSSPMLQALAGKLDAMETSFAGVGKKFKSGSYDPKDVPALDGTVTDVGKSSAGAGAPIKDVPVAIPGT